MSQKTVPFSDHILLVEEVDWTGGRSRDRSIAVMVQISASFPWIILAKIEAASDECFDSEPL